MNDSNATEATFCRLMCWKHDDENGVAMERDFTRLEYRCPREGCDNVITEEHIIENSCQRCHEGPDPDLRTLWMACFYAMNELGLPFEQFAVKGVPQRVAGYDRGIPEFEPLPDASEHLYRYYLLRVCKRCRSEWMGAIAGWFREKV